MPLTEYSAEILAGSWPSQMVMAWSGYAMEYTEAADRLFGQLNVQYDIQDILAPMSGMFIDAARQVALGRQYALMNRIEAYRYASGKAHWAANELHSTKADLVEIVNKAEEDIQKARANAENAKAAAAGNPAVIAAIESQLQTSIASAVAGAKADAQLRDSDGAKTVTGYIGDINNWSQPYANFMLPQSGVFPTSAGDGVPATLAPTPPTGPHVGGSTTKLVDYNTTLKDAKGTPLAQQSNPQTNPQSHVEQSALRNDQEVKDPAATANQRPTTSSPPMSTMPVSGGSSGAGSSGAGSSPGSMFGHMMQPMSSSPGSSASPASATNGMPASAATPNAQGAATSSGGAGAGLAGAGRAVSAAGSGFGIAESAARMGTGAVSTTANALSTAGSVGSQVAQSTAATMAQSSSAATPAAALTAPAAGGAPMAMMPPTAGAAPGAVSGGPPVGPTASNVSSGVPTTPGVQPNTPSYGGVGSSVSGGGSTLAPVVMQGGSPIRTIGADGATGEALYEQAVAASQAVLQALIAQTRTVGYIRTQWAMSLIWERSGLVSAWLATSEGPSYIPLGVRVPENVRLAVTDAVVGRDLWDMSAAAGGADPLEVVVRHAEMRDATAPGQRVLVIASSLPMGRVMDWAGAVGARPASVDPRTVDPATGGDGVLLHRCAVAMPWEWRQADAFTAQDRLKVAARHMRMAAVSGHLTGRACEAVMRLFEERKPISETLWADVKAERNAAAIEFQIAEDMRGMGDADPARAFMNSRAAEVIQCLQHYDTAEGCADILYATRLAGAPLNPAAAVA